MEELLTLDDLAKVLNRSPQTIRKDIRRNPEAVPPRLVLPGTRLLRWRTCDVEEWLERHVQSVQVHSKAALPGAKK
jgi:predicted DNA-binding transcriptional regulator AlpA